MTESSRSLVLDDSGLASLGGSSDSIHDGMMELSTVLSHVSDSHFIVEKSPGAEGTMTESGVPFWSLLWEREDIDRDVRTLLGIQVDQLRELPEDEIGALEISVDGAVCVSPAVAVAATVARVAGAITTSSVGRRCLVDVIVPEINAAAPVFFLVLPEDLAGCVRSDLVRLPCSEDELVAWAALAFPMLRFADGVWSQMRRFAGPFSEVRSWLLSALTGLNERGAVIFSEETQPNSIKARLASETSLECSPESPKTRHNAAAMAERRASILGQEVMCEWHVKMSPTSNRIHFAFSEGRVIIGVFADHLTV